MEGLVRRLTVATGFAALALVTAPGCEPLFGRGPASPANDSGDALALCNAKSARVARCEPARAPELAGACDSVRDTHALRADWVRAELACFANEACAAQDDCETVGYRSIGVSPEAWPPVVRRCVQMGDLCGGSFETCRRLTAMTDGARADALRCFSTSSCDEYSACFHDFVASRLEPAVPTW
jgi:hypothetical protein